jgi:hypothetical protein
MKDEWKYQWVNRISQGGYVKRNSLVHVLRFTFHVVFSPLDSKRAISIHASSLFCKGSALSYNFMLA